jgi:hypothetical protein
MFLGFIDNFTEKGIKFTSKGIDTDTITDVSYSPEKR